MKIIRFCDRTPSVDRIKIGNEMDNLAESIRFDLPEWSDAVVSLYISNGKYSDVILLGSDRIYQPKREHTQHPGRWTAYLEAQRDGDVVWHSDTFALVIGDLPPTGEKVEQAYPTAVETAMQAAAQTLRDKESTEKARKAAEDAADAASTAAGIAHDASANAGNAAQRAYNAANNAAQSAQSAANAAQSAAEIEQRTAQKVTEINDSTSRIAVDVETLAPGSEAIAESSISPADGINIKLGVPRGEKGADAPQIDDTQASAEHPWSGAKVETEIRQAIAAEQTAREAADTALRADLTANAAADAETKRSLDALWRLNQGISYQFETDDAEAYSKTVPTGAKLASVESVGGKTVVWNQGVNGDANAANTNASISNSMIIYYVPSPSNYAIPMIENHWYFCSARVVVDTDYPLRSDNVYGAFGVGYGAKSYTIDVAQRIACSSDHLGKYIFNAQKSQTEKFDSPNVYMRLWTSIDKDSEPGTFAIVSFTEQMIIDLTILFGSGNEPTSINDPRIAWVMQYYADHPEQHAGELVSADVASVKHNDAVAADIPAAVRALPGYGWSAGDVCNSIERTETGWQYVQRVAARDYQDGDTVTDGTTTYYELDEPIITDITDPMNDFPAHFEVEAGGTLSFDNAAKLPVPNTEKYLIALAEVGAWRK